jgi:hypothetical protein
MDEGMDMMEKDKILELLVCARFIAVILREQAEDFSIVFIHNIEYNIGKLIPYIDNQ